VPATLRYPTGGEYRDAMFDTARCFKDPALSGGAVVLDQLGMPRPISGNFASVFTITGTDGRLWAVKCFTRGVEDQARRYEAISEALRRVDRPWSVGFEYLPEGVLCQGRWYPALKMEWVEGTGLVAFIEAHVWDPPAIASLAAGFAALVADLRELGIAHGDLQHGNLLVTDAGDLRLIDYDGMYVPALAALGASELGHANYQSPARTLADWGSKLDNFSAWVIYGSLVAVTLDPTLWGRLHQPGDEALLFHQADFGDRRSSAAINAMVRSGDADLRALARSLGGLWAPAVELVPPLDPRAAPPPSRVALGGPPPAVVEPTVPQPDTSWLLGHLDAAPVLPFDPPVRPLRALGAAGIFSIVALLTAGLIGILPLGPAITMAAIYAVLAACFSIIPWHATAEYEARAAVEARSRSRDRAARAARRTVERLEAERTALETRQERTEAAISEGGEAARTGEARDLETLERRTAARLAALTERRRQLSSREAADIQAALGVVQDRHVYDRLCAARLRSALLPGINQNLVTVLIDHGIETAADFIGVTGGEPVQVELRYGRFVEPPGLNTLRAGTLDRWRKSIEGEARRSQPASLPAARLDAIRAGTEAEKQAVTQEERAVRAETARERDELHRQAADRQAELARDLVRSRRALVRDREELDDNLTGAQRELRAADWNKGLARRDLAAHRRATYLQYLRRGLNL
jgi:hypothetical protein